MWIPIKEHFKIPPFVKEVMQKLTGANYTAFLVGGCVRDFLIGRSVKDYDIVTDAKPEQVTELFPRALLVGAQFGVVKIPIESNVVVEVATFRRDLEYKDFRRPRGVEYGSAEDDAQRRDFTINALFYDPKTQRVLDLVSGVEDLNKKIIKTVGDPAQRFQEDALRLLRAIRFEATLGFKLEAETRKAIQKLSKNIEKISAERIQDEMNKIMKAPNVHLAMRALDETNLLRSVLPEMVETKNVVQSPLLQTDDTIWEHTLKRLRVMEELYPERTLGLSWGVLLSDVGKPRAGHRNSFKNFHEFELDGAELARQIGRRFRMSGELISRIGALVLEQIKFKDVFQMREANLQRWIREPYFADLLALHHVSSIAGDGNLAYFEFCSSLLRELKGKPAVPRLIDGNDLIQMGFGPGPEFSRILKTIEDLALEGKLTTKEAALEYVLQNFVK